VHFMGHELTNNGLKSDMRKVDAVLSMPAATDRQGVMRLLGGVGIYYVGPVGQ